MKITAFFTNGGTPATGLSPTIDGWEVGASQVITAQGMSEDGLGFYYYEFAAYDETKNYVFRCDGTVTLSGYDRYTFGSNRDDLEMATKLPTNYLMGSSVAGDKDTVIDAIDGKTTNLPTDPADQSQVEAAISSAVSPLATESNATSNKTAIISEVDANETKIDTVITDIGNLNDFDPSTEEVDIGEVKGVAVAGVGDFKASVGGLAPANEYDTELDVAVSTRAPANEYDVQLDVNMSTRSPANEYDSELTAIQADLDNPGQYMANVSALALETTVQAIKALTDNLPADTELELIKLKGLGGIWLVAEYHHDINNDNDYIEFWQYGNQTDFDNETKGNAIWKYRQDITYTANLPQKSKWDKVT